MDRRARSAGSESVDQHLCSRTDAPSGRLKRPSSAVPGDATQTRLRSPVRPADPRVGMAGQGVSPWGKRRDRRCDPNRTVSPAGHVPTTALRTSGPTTPTRAEDTSNQSPNGVWSACRGAAGPTEGPLGPESTQRIPRQIGRR
jgi:hypothetical protein